MSLTDKVIVVTGAGSGIGQAIAVGAAAEGARTVLFGRKLASLQATQEQCAGGQSIVVAGDVNSSDDVRELFEVCAREFGAVDILFNCAGLNAQGSFADIETAEWLAAVNTNLLGTALCCRAAIDQMRTSGSGRIINLGSRMAADINPGWSAYSVSKAGVTTLTRALAADLAAMGLTGILVNELIPGMTRSSMSATGQDPSEVWPWARELACAADGSPSGQSYFRGQTIDIWGPPKQDSLLARLLGGLRTG